MTRTSEIGPRHLRALCGRVVAVGFDWMAVRFGPLTYVNGALLLFNYIHCHHPSKYHSPSMCAACHQYHSKISPRKKIIFSFFFWFHLIFLLLFFKVSLNKWVQSRIRHERRGEAKWHNMRKRGGGGTLSIFYINKCRILYTRNVRKSNRFAKRCCQINLCENSFPWWDYLLLLIPMIDGSYCWILYFI